MEWLQLLLAFLFASISTVCVPVQPSLYLLHAAYVSHSRNSAWEPYNCFYFYISSRRKLIAATELHSFVIKILSLSEKIPCMHKHIHIKCPYTLSLSHFIHIHFKNNLYKFHGCWRFFNFYFCFLWRNGW